MNQEKANKIYRINGLYQECESVYHQVALHFHMSDSSLKILYTIYVNYGKCLLYDIYSASGISKQTVNSAIRKLEKEELIYLENFNKKSKIVNFTEKGSEYAQKTVAPLFKAECNAFEDWSERDFKLYLLLIEKHNVSLRKQIDQLCQEEQNESNNTIK